MEGALFALVDNERDEIFAWGMEITVPDNAGGTLTSALVYRPGICGAQNLISVHNSAGSAHSAYARIMPVTLEWDTALHHSAR